MKKLLTLLLLTIALHINAQVAINTSGSAPNSNAMLDISSNTKGVLIPRFTTTERTTLSLTSTEDGLTVYDTDTKSFWYWDGTAWVEIISSSIAQDDKDWFVSGTTNAPTNINDDMYHMGKVGVGLNTPVAQMDILSSANATALNVKNTYAAGNLNTAGYFDVGGQSTTTTGKLGVYSTVGNDNGTLTAFEAGVYGGANNNYQYAFTSVIGGNNDGTHIGMYNYLYGNGNGERRGSTNWIVGNSNGNIYLYYGLSDNTGNGIHFGNYYRLGGSGNGVQYGSFNRITNSGTGQQFGVLTELKANGNAAHVGTANILGAGVPENNPAAIVPITNDSDGKRTGTINTIAGNGNGIHLGIGNTIISTGNGQHVGTSNVIGYNYLTSTATNTTGEHIGTFNNMNDQGNGSHIASYNVLGLDVINNTEINSNGDHFGTINLLAGGQQNTALSGVQMGNINTIIAKSDANAFPWGGRQYGAYNSIGRDIINNPFIVTNNGDGDHFATYNEVVDSGNGTHVASYNVVSNSGSGRHVAVYGQVDDNDLTAWAGMFKGYTTSKNQVSTINLWSGNEYTVFQNTNTDLNLMEAGFNPVIYQLQGLVQVKVFVRVSGASGLGNQFQLHAINNASDVTPITTSDTWTWNNTSPGKYIVESQWKAWNAGTDVWELHLTGITDSSSTMKITNVYVMVRPLQLSGTP